jgi:hypothetical protein
MTKENTLPTNVADCLKGWCLDEGCLTEDDRDLLIEAATYKRTRYAIVSREKLKGLQKLGLLYIEENGREPDQPYFLFRNGAWVNMSMAPDFLDDCVILVFFKDPDMPAATKMWEKFFRADEFQNMYNGLVAMMGRAISARVQEEKVSGVYNPESDEQEPGDFPHQTIYIQHMQIANLIING